MQRLVNSHLDHTSIVYTFRIIIDDALVDRPIEVLVVFSHVASSV